MYVAAMSHSMEIRRLVLRKVFDKVPNHAKDIRELTDSRCTGFCRLLDFTRGAPQEVYTLIFRISIASLGSYYRGGIHMSGGHQKYPAPHHNRLIRGGMLLLAEEDMRDSQEALDG